MHYKYEVHLVAYRGTSSLKMPFDDKDEQSKTILLKTDAPLSEIITPIETNNLIEARSVFWNELRSLSLFQGKIQAHVKLEELQESIFLNHAQKEFLKVKYPRLLPSISYQKNMFAGAWGWDVHIEGKFHPSLLHYLREKGWIYLEYAEDNSAWVVLTKHYLDRNSCEVSYRRIVEYLSCEGGFVGKIYWEAPVSYCVYESNEENSYGTDC